MSLRMGLGGLALVSVFLSGCVFEDDPAAPAAGSPSTVRLAPVGTEEALAARISTGKLLSGGGELRSQQMVGAPTRFSGVQVMADGSGMAPTAEGGGGATGGTGGAMTGDPSVPADDGLNNVQVTGVEEADRVKSDGVYLYVAEQPDRWIYPMPVETIGGGTVDPVPLMKDRSPRVLLAADMISPRDGIALTVGDLLPPIDVTEPAPRIARFHLDSATPGATALPALELAGGTGYISHLNLLLSGGDSPRLVAMGQSGNYWTFQRWFKEQPYVNTQETRLWIFDVADPENVPAPATLVLKGELVDSRRVGDHVYLVTRYSPAPGTDPLVPQLLVDGNERPLLPPGECLVPASGAQGYPSLTFVVAVDLADPSASKAACYSGEVYTMYMSRDALYLAAQRYNNDFNWLVGVEPVPVASEPGVAIGEPSPDGSVGTAADTADEEPAPLAPVDTIVHRFDLNDGDPEYTGSGIVAGGFTGWMGTGSNPQWRFNERNGLLYLVTSWWDYDDLHHHLYVLAPDDDGDLVVAATLPNAESPEAIGKPREDIFAMRYVGDRAYIVTFQQTDPLYVLDLADPLQPVVAGSLMLPGFSAYLHPVGADWLLGIGRGADGRTGLEVNLFDVRDPANPLVRDHEVVCASCTAPILTDYHAIAVLGRNGTTRVAIPLQDWTMADEYSWVPVEQAALLEIDPVAGKVNRVGTQDAPAGYTALGRVLLIADAVFQPLKGAVASGSWPVPVAL